MKLSNIENRIKNLFQNQEAPLDIEAFWDELEPKLEKKKKRRFIFWFLLGGLLLGYGLYQANPTAKNIIAEKTPIRSLEESTPLKNEWSTPVRSDQSQKEQMASVNSTNLADLKAITTPNTPKSVLNKSQKNIQKITQTFPVPNKVVDFHIAKNIDKTSLKNNTPKKIFEKVDQKTRNSNHIDLIQNNSTAQQSNPIETEKPTLPKTEKKHISQSSKDDVKKNILARKKAIKEKLAKRKRARRKRKIKKLFNKWSMNVDIASGYDYGIKILRANSKEYAYLPDLRRKSEKMLETIPVSIHLDFRHKKGFLLDFGIDYRQMNQTLELSYSYTRTNVKNDIIEIVQDNYGNTISEKYGKVTSQYFYKIKKKIYNKYYMINIPVNLGYFVKNKKSFYEILGGLDVNIFSKRKGQILNSNDNEVLYIESDFLSRTRRYYSTTGVGLTGSFKYGRKISKKISVYAAPYFKLNFRPISTKALRVEEKYHFVGIHLGMKIDVK